MSPQPSDSNGQHRLQAEDVALGYDGQLVVDSLTLTVPPERITAIVGANACGKSTLLRGLARLLAPERGSVLLDGEQIHRLPTKQVARMLGLLPQSAVAPDGMTVLDLVRRGRFPHQGWLRQWTQEDEQVIALAIRQAGVSDLTGRSVDSLSGGQRQRVWIAMALAQETPIMLLDEPTTYLDISHQCEVLDLLVDLNRLEGRTVILVLHDLNQACRYADHLVAMTDGRIAAEGPPADIVTPSLVEAVFDLECEIWPDPLTGTPLVIPVPRGSPARRATQEETHSNPSKGALR